MSLALEAEVKKAGSANIDADDVLERPNQPAEPAEHSKYCEFLPSKISVKIVVKTCHSHWKPKSEKQEVLRLMLMTF